MNFSPFFMPLPVGIWHVNFTVRTSIRPINVRHQYWEQSMGMIWNWVCSFIMMGCIVGVTVVTVANQLPVRRGYTCPMDTFPLVLSTFMSSVFSAYITYKSMISQHDLFTISVLDGNFTPKHKLFLLQKCFKINAKFLYWNTCIPLTTFVFQKQYFPHFFRIFTPS
jgi:hypothetical protein